jgi:hypothetical protein
MGWNKGIASHLPNTVRPLSGYFEMKLSALLLWISRLSEAKQRQFKALPHNRKYNLVHGKLWVLWCCRQERAFKRVRRGRRRCGTHEE